MNIQFSVIIPTYNRAESLINSLTSLADQTYKNFEVIICDDGSTDNTEQVVSQFSSNLNIIYFRNENWGGPAKPRNIGINESRGNWICFLDSDDWWYPNKLNECAKYIEKYDFLYHRLDVFNSSLEKITNKKIGFKFYGKMLNHLLINGNCIPNSSVAIRKSLLLKTGFFSEDKDKISMEDFDLWIRVAQNTDNFIFIDKSLGVYNWEDDTNISRISINRIIKEKKIFYEYLFLLGDENQTLAINNFNYKIGRFYTMMGDYTRGNKYLIKSVSGRKLLGKLKSIYHLIKIQLIG